MWMNYIRKAIFSPLIKKGRDESATIEWMDPGRYLPSVACEQVDLSSVNLLFENFGLFLGLGHFNHFLGFRAVVDMADKDHAREHFVAVNNKKSLV